MDEQNRSAEVNQQPEQELSEILRIRREKLAALQEAGRDPYQETIYDVNAYAKGTSSALPGKAYTSLLYEKASLDVVIPPPLFFDSINIVASASPAIILLRLRKCMARGDVPGG